MTTHYEKQLEKFAEEMKANNQNDYASEFAKILNSDSHKKIFKVAEQKCSCPVDCDCSGEKCICKKTSSNCDLQCKSCGKDQKVEAQLSLIQDMIKASNTLDECGFTNKAKTALHMAMRLMKKLASKDVNDVRMKDLPHGGKGKWPKADLSKEIEELDKDPEYMQFAKDPEYFRFEQSQRSSPELLDAELERIAPKGREKAIKETEHAIEQGLAEDELDRFLEGKDDYSNLDDEDEELKRLLFEGDLDPREEELLEADVPSMELLRETDPAPRPVTEPSPSYSYHDTEKPLYFEPDTMEPEAPTQRDTPISPFPSPFKTPKLPDFSDEESMWADASKKLDQYFKKMAEEENEDDENFEDEE